MTENPDDKMADKDNEWPPQPLDHEWLKWYVGEWQGWTETPMGKTKLSQKCEFDLGGQFFMIHFSDESVPGGYHGRGVITLNRHGEVVGFWIDNMRTLSQGKGRIEGRKLIMEWRDQWSTLTRTAERVDPNKSIETFVLIDHQGKKMEGKAELARVG